MFLVLPYKTDLRLARLPIITYAIILLCFIIHFIQDENRGKINTVAKTYCESIYQSDAKERDVDFLIVDKEICVSKITFYHGVDNPTRFLKAFEKYNKEGFSENEFVTVASLFNSHLAEFKKTAPKDVDSFLSYDPSSWNPASMMLSAFSHGDWWHIWGNIIFFFAFAPALEILARSTWRFILALILIELTCDIPYSFVSMYAEYPVPTLGLSGIVMGMIGLSAYMMPWARINTFVWFIHFAKSIPIPAKFVALWYFGWDSYELLSNDENTGVNVLAHVMGAIGGYLAGMFLFKKSREENRYELDNEIDFMRAKRQDGFSLANTYKGDSKVFENRQREDAYIKEKGKFHDRLFKLITVGKHAVAINLILDEYTDDFQLTPYFEDLLLTLKDWHIGRSFYCLGRLVLNDYMESQQYGAAIRVAKICYKLDKDFLLANPIHIQTLAKECMACNENNLAYLLVRDTKSRYSGFLNNKKSEELELLLQGEYS